MTMPEAHALPYFVVFLTMVVPLAVIVCALVAPEVALAARRLRSRVKKATAL